MKKTILLLILMGIAPMMFGQMVFETGSWTDVKAKAIKENKLIFIDMYTSWCGPCKVMVNTIFPLPQSGEFYNKHFVLYKVDAEKGEGVAIAKQYGVNSYPTYLFVDGTGKVFYRSGGSMPVEKFIKEGETALAQFADKKTIEEWDAEYLRKKNDPAFVREYIAKRELLKLDNSDVLDGYVGIAKKEEMLTKEFLKNVISSNGKINAGGPFFNFLMEHFEKLPEISGMSREMLLYNFPFLTTLYSVGKAAKTNDEVFFERILEGNKRLAELSGDSISDLYLRSLYYSKTKQGEKLAAMACEYAEALLSSVPEILEKDKAGWDKYLEGISQKPEQLQGKSTQDLALTFSFRRTNQASGLSYKIRDLALNVSALCEDRELKYKALEWAYTASLLFENFSNYEAIAVAYYELGNKKGGKYWLDRCKAILPSQAPDDIRSRVDGRER